MSTTDQPINKLTDQLPPALIVFVRAPELGKVKTRVAAEVGEVTTLALYRKLLAHTAGVVGELDVARYVFYAGPIPEADDWSGAGCTRLPQAEGDLGARMEAAFEEVWARGHGKAVIIGSDCPGLTAMHIRNALDALDTSELVLGPSTDGGYYLLAQKQLWATLFRDMAWSTSAVLEETLERAMQAGLQVHQLEPLTDVDHWSDVPPAWRQELAG